MKNKPIAILGCDPGFTGAIALLDLSLPKNPKVHSVQDLPIYKTKTAQRKSGEFKHLDAFELSKIVEGWKENFDIRLCVLEAPTAMPKQGISSTFRFGETCGRIHGALAGCSVPIQLVSPAMWKMSLGLPSDKAAAISKAVKDYPETKGRIYLKKHDGRAEAVLLARYGERFLQILWA